MTPRIGFLVGMLFCSAFCVAQTGTATLSGTIKDVTGAVMPGVQVEVTNQETAVGVTTTTNDAGVYIVPSLKPGWYRVVATKQGFKQVRLTNLRLNVGDTMSQDFALEIGTTSESITVVAEAERMNTTDASVGAVVERQVVDNMPLNGRSFQGLITLTPGVSTVAVGGVNTPGQFVVNGQRNDTNYFTMDGVSANVAAPPLGSVNTAGTGSAPTATVGGGYNNIVSIDALQEFRISTSTFAPEFGRTPGGQISMVSRSGANAFHGDAFDYLRNTVLDANDWFLNAKGKPRPVVRQNDFGGVFGGRIIKDKLFFFASYEGLRLSAPSPAIKQVPTQAARTLAAATNANGVIGYMAQFLNSYPLPDGNPATPCTSAATCIAGYTASLPGTSQLDSTSVRIDYHLGQNMNLFGRYSHAPSNTTSLNTVTSSALQAGNDVYTAGWSYFINTHLNSDLRFNFTHTTFLLSVNPVRFKGDLTTIFPSGYAQPPSGYTLPQMSIRMGSWNGGVDNWQLALANTNNGNDQINFTEAVSWVKGSHGLKFGADFRQLNPAFDQSNFNSNNQFAGTNNCPGGTPAYICGIANLANIQHNVPQHFRFREYSFFGQDTWKASQRLTLTYGLRYEVNPPVDYTNGYPGFSVAQAGFDLTNMRNYTLNPLGSPAFSTRWGNVSPRVGMAYQLSKDPKWGSVLRAGYGVFYDTGNQAFALSSAPWNARCNNTAACTTPPFTGPPLATVPFPVASDNARFVSPPVIPSPPSFPLALQSDILIDPNFKLPYVHEMNFTIEQQLGKSQTLSIGYVGALGKRLISGLLFPSNLTNPNVLGQGAGCPTAATVGCGDVLTITGNYATSDYHALQTKFQRQFSAGLSFLASYTWSHSIDDASTDAPNVAEPATVPTATSLAAGQASILLRGSSDFDIRHTLGASLVYDLPTPFKSSALARAVLGHWSFDPIYHYQTGAPLEIFTLTVASLNGATNLAQRPNLIPGVPIYVYGSDCVAQYASQGIYGCPGGRALNAAPVSAAMASSAGCLAPTATNAKGAFCTPLPVGSQAVSGNFGRNVVRGFSLQQFDLSLHRDFPIRGEQIRLRFQTDMFNVFNHPQFGPPGYNASCNCANMSNSTFALVSSMANSTLGSALNSGVGFNPLYNIGGPRNFQFAMKLFF